MYCSMLLYAAGGQSLKQIILEVHICETEIYDIRFGGCKDKLEIGQGVSIHISNCYITLG